MHMLLLSACSSESHATKFSTLISYYQINNKRNRVKGQHWEMANLRPTWGWGGGVLHFFAFKVGLSKNAVVGCFREGGRRQRPALFILILLDIIKTTLIQVVFHISDRF